MLFQFLQNLSTERSCSDRTDRQKSRDQYFGKYERHTINIFKQEDKESDMPQHPIFIDGVEKVQWLSGTIRMELFYKKPTEYDEGNKESAGELIMTVDGFLSTMNAMQQTADMLVEKGILKHKDKEDK